MAAAQDLNALVTDRFHELRDAFARIHRERMAGLPILNPSLTVSVVGVRKWRDDWIAMLITPWSMNLIVLPGPESAFVPGAVGSKQVVEFPAGSFELIASAEEGVGAFAACSMFSPMHEFADQAVADATAEQIVTALFNPADGTAARFHSEQAAPEVEPKRPAISRRDLLRGRLGGPKPD
ncbi:MAG: [NiFe]-hydrogenase assembly chaperone HybE [Thiohalocapsa sp.]